MKNTKKHGFTLLELLVGFVIIASVAVVFFQSMHRFRKESTFNSENYLASSLIEKVLEQCYQESQLNPHGMKAIGLADAAGEPYTVSTQVTDKATVFFSNPAITQESTPDLHNILQDNYILTVNTSKEEGYYEMVAGLSWNAQSGKGQVFSSSRVLAFTGKKEVLTTFELTDDEVKNRLVSDVFNSPGSNLSAKLASIGAQTLLVHVGHIFYSCLDWLKSDELKERRERIESLEVFTSAASAEYAKCSQLYFELARDLLHLMLSLQPHIEKANSNINFLPSIQLPEKFIAESRINRSGLYFRQLRRIFFNCLLKLSERYEQQLKYADLQRGQQQMVVRLFNINRILYANRAFSEEISANTIEKRYETFLDTICTFFRDKDLSVYRMAEQERNFIATDKLSENFLTLQLTNQLFKEINDYVNILD